MDEFYDQRLAWLQECERRLAEDKAWRERVRQSNPRPTKRLAERVKRNTGGILISDKLTIEPVVWRSTPSSYLGSSNSDNEARFIEISLARVKFLEDKQGGVDEVARISNSDKTQLHGESGRAPTTGLAAIFGLVT